MEKQIIGKYKLLPCPFCGEYPSVHSGKTECVGHGSYDTQMTIECKCGISLCKSDWDEPNKIWNARIEKESDMEEETKAEGKPMKVEGFLTIDGKFFQTEEEAIEHEKLLTIKGMLEGTSLRLHSGDIIKFIEDNKDRLRKVFYE